VPSYALSSSQSSLVSLVLRSFPTRRSSDLFDATHLFGGGKLHADRNGRQALQFGRMWIRGNAADLGLQFAVAGGVNGSERRTGRRQRLRIGDAACGAENVQKLIALATDAAKHTPFLED